MVDTNQNSVITMLKEHKDRLVLRNEGLNETIRESQRLLDECTVKRNENNNQIKEIEQAIFKLETK